MGLKTPFTNFGLKYDNLGKEKSQISLKLEKFDETLRLG